MVTLPSGRAPACGLALAPRKQRGNLEQYIDDHQGVALDAKWGIDADRETAYVFP
jgi:hypothetical protein